MQIDRRFDERNLNYYSNKIEDENDMVYIPQTAVSLAVIQSAI